MALSGWIQWRKANTQRQADFGCGRAAPGRRFHLLVSLALLGFALAGCSFLGEDGGSSGLAAVDLVDQVELIVSGDEPRSTVRYRFDSDDSVVAVSTDLVRVGQQMVASSDPDPSDGESGAVPAAELDATIVTEARVTARPADAAADAEAELFVVDREIVDASVGDATSPMVAEAVGATVESRIGSRVEQVINDRGWRYADQTSDPVDQADAADSSASGSASGTASVAAALGFEAVSVGVDLIALPDEPIGEGAEWKTTTTIDGVDGTRTAVMLVNVVDMYRDAQGHPVSLTLEVEMSSERTEASTSVPVGEVEQAGSGLVGSVVVDLVEPVHQAVLSSWTLQVAAAEGLFAGTDDVAEAISDRSVYQRVEVESTVDVRR